LQQHVSEACARHRPGRFIGKKRLERIDVDERVLGEHAQLADQVAQLPDVARPCVLGQPADGRRRKFEATRVLRREVGDESRDVLDALFEAGNGEHENRQPVKQVFAEQTFAREFAQVAVSRGNHAAREMQIGR
jgi:hypothetical protein